MRMQILCDLINLYTDNAIPAYDCGDGVLLYKIEFEGDFDPCAGEALLIKAGFFPERKNEIEGNRAYTYRSPTKGRIHIYFIPSEKALRILFDPFSNAALSGEKKTAGKCPVRFWQFEIDHSLIDCGMCYIFQLSDYSFFMIDSAHHYSVNDDQRIYDFLRKQTPEDLPVTVSGWFFTHGHIDHTGKFLDLLRFNRNVRIEALYYNFIPTKYFSYFSLDPADRNFADGFIKTVEEREMKVYKLHTLDGFYVKDIKINVLCTHEDVFPEKMENYNDSSTVIMVEVNEDKVCFPGDAGHTESRILERRFPKYLRSDIVQQAHHGHFGTSAHFYELTNADVVLFPTTQIKFDEEYPRFAANAASVNIARHCFIASNGTVEFTFPLRENKIKLYPDEIFENFNGIYNLWGYEYTEERKNRLQKEFSERQNIRLIEW